MISKNPVEPAALRITSKGQVTIPQKIRERLGLLPHTEVTFEIDGNAVRIRKAGKRDTGRGRGLIRRMRGRSSVRMSTDEIMSLTRNSPQAAVPMAPPAWRTPGGAGDGTSEAAWMATPKEAPQSCCPTEHPSRNPSSSRPGWGMHKMINDI